MTSTIHVPLCLVAPSAPGPEEVYAALWLIALQGDELGAQLLAAVEELAREYFERWPAERRRSSRRGDYGTLCRATHGVCEAGGSRTGRQEPRSSAPAVAASSCPRSTPARHRGVSLLGYYQSAELDVTILRALETTSGAPAAATDIARISPLAHAHVIPSGTYHFARATMLAVARSGPQGDFIGAA